MQEVGFLDFMGILAIFVGFMVLVKWVMMAATQSSMKPGDIDDKENIWFSKKKYIVLPILFALSILSGSDMIPDKPKSCEISNAEFILMIVCFAIATLFAVFIGGMALGL